MVDSTLPGGTLSFENATGTLGASSLGNAKPLSQKRDLDKIGSQSS